MRILIVNYRYFISGGPERYMFNIISALEEHGHEVIPFSVKSQRNVPTEYERYFVDPIGGMNAVYYEDYKKTPKNVWKMFTRAVYSTEVRKALEKEIRETKPDIVYILQCINKLSPSVIDAAVKCKTPVIWRLSDYQLMCPRFDFYRESGPCELCADKGLHNAIRYKCVKRSRAASAVRVFAMWFQRKLHLGDKVDMYITPSAFLRDKLIEKGFDGAKIVNIPTFAAIDEEALSVETGERHDAQTEDTYGLYFGRIEPQKDIETVIHAYEILSDHNLVIAGDDTTAEAVRLKKYVEEHDLKNIRFVGFKKGAELNRVIWESRFTVLPFTSYDNLPNSALESFRYGKPVIASNIGSLRELVSDGINGYAYEPGNVDQLVGCIRKMDDDETAGKMGTECKNLIDTKFSAASHYEQLMKVFEKVCAEYAEP